jgi:hypothetical protein
MTRGQTVKYTPAPEQQRCRDQVPYLCLVPSQSTQGVGAEAGEVALLMEELTASINRSETLSRALLSRFEEDARPVDYNHVEGRHVGKLKVRYRNVGRLLPREIPIEDE